MSRYDEINAVTNEGTRNRTVGSAASISPNYNSWDQSHRVRKDMKFLIDSGFCHLLDVALIPPPNSFAPKHDPVVTATLEIKMLKGR